MKIIFGNLKMNFLYKDFQRYIDDLRMKMEKENPQTLMGLAIPYIYLKESAEKIGTTVKIIAQDLHPSDFGAFTSSVSAAQLASLEIPATLIGHSECRALSQNSLVITNKVIAALNYGMEVIYCCGKDPVEEIQDELKTLKKGDWKKMIIAYEPLSAIGSGSAMNPSDANAVIGTLKNTVRDKFGEEALAGARFLYGGSVNLKNYKEFLAQSNIDGVLVGGASLNVDDFWKMVTLN